MAEITKIAFNVDNSSDFADAVSGECKSVPGAYNQDEINNYILKSLEYQARHIGTVETVQPSICRDWDKVYLLMVTGHEITGSTITYNLHFEGFLK